MTFNKTFQKLSRTKTLLNFYSLYIFNITCYTNNAKTSRSSNFACNTNNFIKCFKTVLSFLKTFVPQLNGIKMTINKIIDSILFEMWQKEDVVLTFWGFRT